MCIRYNIEFWLPAGDNNTDWERRIERGLAQPGQNHSARVIHFFECQGQLLLQSRCPLNRITQAGCYRNYILDFCHCDRDCYFRLEELQAACTAAKRHAEAMDRVREAATIQQAATAAWKKAYDDWMSAYEQHRDCPKRRDASPLVRDLKRAEVLADMARMSDQDRMGAHPSTAKEPILGIQRHYDEPRPRR